MDFSRGKKRKYTNGEIIAPPFRRGADVVLRTIWNGITGKTLHWNKTATVAFNELYASVETLDRTGRILLSQLLVNSAVIALRLFMPDRGGKLMKVNVKEIRTETFRSVYTALVAYQIATICKENSELRTFVEKDFGVVVGDPISAHEQIDRFTGWCSGRPEDAVHLWRILSETVGCEPRPEDFISWNVLYSIVLSLLYDHGKVDSLRSPNA